MSGFYVLVQAGVSFTETGCRPPSEGLQVVSVQQKSIFEEKMAVLEIPLFPKPSLSLGSIESPEISQHKVGNNRYKGERVTKVVFVVTACQQ